MVILCYIQLGKASIFQVPSYLHFCNHIHQYYFLILTAVSVTEYSYRASLRKGFLYSHDSIAYRTSDYQYEVSSFCKKNKLFLAKHSDCCDRNSDEGPSHHAKLGAQMIASMKLPLQVLYPLGFFAPTENHLFSGSPTPTHTTQ